MNDPRLLVTAMAAALVAGCGGMSAAECELADWRAVGYEDGARGRPAEAFGEHRRACAKHEVAPDFADYQAGREAGLRAYCTPERGYREGARGAGYDGVCPAELEDEFYEAFIEGQTLYMLESAVAKTRGEIESNRARMNRIEQDIAGRTAAALGGELTAEQAADAIVRTKQLAEERLRLADENERLAERLERQQAELDAHREGLQARR